MSRYLKLTAAAIALAGLLAPAFAQRDKISITPLFASYYGVQGQRLQSPNGIFFHKKRQEIYLADSGSHQIVIFDKKGTAVGKFTHMVDAPDKKDRIEGEPRGVALNSRGDIFVTDNLASYVDLLDYRGRSLKKIYPADYLKLSREKVMPIHLAVDADDNLYITVAGDESCILVLDKAFNLKSKIGKKGDGKGEFQSASGVWIDSGGRIYATDALGTALQVFDKDGKFLFGVGDRSGFGPLSFGLPSGCVTDKQGNIWVLDGAQCKVAVFDSNGGWINNICGAGAGPGDVLYPTYITGDGEDTIYIAERTGRRLQAIKIDFKL